MYRVALMLPMVVRIFSFRRVVRGVLLKSARLVYRTHRTHRTHRGWPGFASVAAPCVIQHGGLSLRWINDQVAKILRMVLDRKEIKHAFAAVQLACY